MDTQTSPFAVMSLIVAPAILTNASSVLALSTSNRLGRTVDRARELSKQLEGTADLSSPEASRRLHELTAAEQRTLMLLSALRSFYFALGSFAAAALLTLLAAVTVPTGYALLINLLEGASVLTGILAVAMLVNGSWVLVGETRIMVRIVQDRAASVQARAATQSATGVPKLGR